MKKILLLLFLGTISTYAQQDAWVYFTDKENVQASIDNPISILTQEAIDRKAMHNTSIDERDVPVTEDYIAEIKAQEGIVVLAKSKWFNCVHVRGGLENIESLLDLSFVNTIEYADRSRNRVSDDFQFQKEGPEQRVDFTYGSTENQVTMLSIDEVHLEDFTGEGMIVAIMDSGFSGVDVQDGFARIRDNGKLLDGYDFVGKVDDEFAFQGSDHGTRVVSDIAGFIENQFVGTAPGAKIYCFRTEDVASENPVEESNWVEAAERADSLGVDVINTSLGYRDYDFDPYDLTYEDMDGETAFISRGATIAFEKGMLVVTSAGNSGTGMIAAPADAVGALTVGAVDSEGNYASFSSIGPSSDGRVKPDVMAKGANAAVIRSNGTITTSNGTSFSSPIMAGAVASIWQAKPELTNAELMQFIREAGSTFDNPTPQFGYGIPDFGTLLQTLLGVDDSAFAKAYTLKPIPTSDRFQVGLPEGVSAASLQLFNMIGQEVHSENITNDNQWVDISELKVGIYLARLESKSISRTIKIIKK